MPPAGELLHQRRRMGTRENRLKLLGHHQLSPGTGATVSRTQVIFTIGITSKVADRHRGTRHERVWMIAVVGIGSLGGVLAPPGVGHVPQRQSDRGPGLEAGLLGLLALVSAVLVERQLPGQREPDSDGPDERVFEIVAVDADLTAGVLPRVPEYCQATPTAQQPCMAKPVPAKVSTSSPSLGNSSTCCARLRLRSCLC
jgi:hypothetical protein